MNEPEVTNMQRIADQLAAAMVKWYSAHPEEYKLAHEEKDRKENS